MPAKRFCSSSGREANSEIKVAGIFMAAEVSTPASRAFKAAFRMVFFWASHEQIPRIYKLLLNAAAAYHCSRSLAVF